MENQNKQDQAPRAHLIKVKVGLCELCDKTRPISTLIPAELVRPSIRDAIKRRFKGWDDNGYICRTDWKKIKNDYIQDLIQEETGHLTRLEKQVMRSMRENELLAQNINQQFERELTLGEKIADRVAEFGGSWRFILSFISVLIVWIAVNGFLLAKNPFDPFPFILLNLFLSMLAALQAPIIMMSQNRQEAKDRLRSEYDYKVNLKAELEIRHLNEKLDHLMQYQWKRLLEIQELQLDLIEDMDGKVRGRKK